MPRPMPRVALLVETARGYGRDFLRGVMRYSRLHGPWNLDLTPGDFEQSLPRMPAWDGTGIIARVENPKVARAILRSRLPAIALDLAEHELESGHPLARLSEVASDSVAAAELAASHLLERRFNHYAFVGIHGRVWSDRRQVGFQQAIRRAGFEPMIFPPSRGPSGQAWERELPRLVRWLRQLPHPIGLMACNDDRGREVLEACRVAGLRVPDDVAVVGVDNDELLCELADPPLSSVALDAEMGGYRAAELLDRMMRGRVRTPRRLTVAALRVVTRRSSQIHALDDPLVARALRFLDDHAAQPIDINDLVNHLDVSRRLLEQRFQRHLGRTPHDVLASLRLERARQLLLETDLPLARIAQAAGYANPSYLSQVFRQREGVTPARYRRDHRLRS